MKPKKIKAAWLDYFNFSTRERRGAIFLSCILLVQIAVLACLRNTDPPLRPVDPKIIASLMAEMEKDTTGTSVTDKSALPATIAFQKFDPNRLTLPLAESIGISSRQLKVIQNYLSKGGVFRTKKDFSKMFCIPPEQYALLEPWLLLPDKIVLKNQRSKNDQKPFVPVDIASVDSAGLVSIQGIGPSFAARIVKYRQSLGGFVSVNQLHEVWGIHDTIFEKLLPQIMISDTIPFRFIHLNTDSFNMLSAHPYLRGKIASLICNYRKQHNGFSSAEELLSIPLITEENFRKLAPYLRAD